MKRLLPPVCLLLTACVLLVACRFLFVSSYLRHKKQEFRAEALLAPGAVVLEMRLPLSMLYRDAPGLQWVDQNKELVVNGVFHEVVGFRVNGETVTVLLVEDTAESLLFAAFLADDSEKNGLSVFYYLIASFQFRHPVPANADPARPCTRLVFIPPPAEIPCGGYEPFLLRPPAAFQLRGDRS